MHLGKRTVVQCSNLSDTLFQDGNKIMTSLPTLIVLADMPASAQPDSGQRPLSEVQHKLRIGLESGLPLVLVAPPAIAEKARAILPGNSVVELPTTEPPRGPQQARAIAAGVLSSTHAPGWLLWPAELGLIEPDTLVQLAKAVQQYPMVVPEYRQQRGQPVGLSSEFYSELIRLNTEWDLNRLMNRYPALGIEVNDPGVLIPQDLPFDLHPLAAMQTSTEPRYLAALPY